MATLLSKNGDSKLQLNPINFEFPTPKDEHDKEWIVGDLQFENPYFKAKIFGKPQFYLSQVNKLLENISLLLKDNHGIVEYSGIEPYLALKISLDNTGLAQIEGTIWDVDHNSGKLSFTYESDQTCLNAFFKELQNQIFSLKR